MDLILWRHAEAQDGEPDAERELTAKGVRQAERAGRWLDKQLPDRCRILVSPAVRAQQTARALDRKFKTVNEVGPGASAAGILAAARWPEARDPVLVVGHQPTLGRLAAFLLAGEEAPWSVRKAGIWWFTNRERESGSNVVLRCVIGPDFT